MLRRTFERSFGHFTSFSLLFSILRIEFFIIIRPNIILNLGATIQILPQPDVYVTDVYLLISTFSKVLVRLKVSLVQ